MKKYFFVLSASLICILLLFNLKKSSQTNVTSKLLNPEERLRLVINWEKKEKKERIRMGYPNKHTEIQKLMKTGYGQDGPTYEGGYQLKEFKKLQARNQNARQKTVYSFAERGPGNISGRTRAFFLDANDASQNRRVAPPPPSRTDKQESKQATKGASKRESKLGPFS